MSTIPSVSVRLLHIIIFISRVNTQMHRERDSLEKSVILFHHSALHNFKCKHTHAYTERERERDRDSLEKFVILLILLFITHSLFVGQVERSRNLHLESATERTTLIVALNTSFTPPTNQKGTTSTNLITY